MNDTTTQVLVAARWLSDELAEFVTNPLHPAAYAADPTVYAYNNYATAMARLADGPRGVLLVGMNPGPHGMAQTGVPFGDVYNARALLGRSVQAKPGEQWIDHEIRGLDRVLLKARGLDYHRGEVSGERLWGGLQQLCGSLEAAFARVCVINYCPLLFLDNGGANVTPADFPKSDKVRLPRFTAACDEHLRRVVSALDARIVIAVGGYSDTRCRIALAGSVPIVKITHPSPRVAPSAGAWLGTVAKTINDAFIFAYPGT